MKTTLEVLEKLKEIIEKKLNYKNFSVVLDYPDSDRCIKETTIFLMPDTGLLDNLTTGSDSCSLDITAYIIVRRRGSQDLMVRVFNCFEQLYSLLRGDPTLDGYVSDTEIRDFDYYPSTGVESEKAIEVSLNVLWEKDF